MNALAGQRVVVAGLGRFGGNIAAARWLVEQGARVLVTDAQPVEKLAESVKQLDGLPIEYRLGQQREEDFTSADLVVASPAIMPRHPLLAAARGAGVNVTTEIRLFIERCPATILGVTGTKGKSTATAMLGRMLRRRYNVFVGGNIGSSLLPELPRIGKTDLVVLELSSYMLHYLREMHWSPHIAVVTFLATDHVEWHGSREQYIEAKKTIVQFQRPDDFVVVNEECPACREFASLSHGRVMMYGIEGRKPLELKVPGRHNQLNAQAALAAANILDISWQDAQEALRDFPGLPHRLQLVHQEDGVSYYNDSIATIPEAAAAALESFPAKKVIQIVGGYDSHAPMTALCAALVERAKAALCIGQTGPMLAAMMGQSPHNAAAAVYECGDLATAVKVAKQIAAPGDVVLLSTGCKSFDQFVNFEERGETFARLVRGAHI